MQIESPSEAVATEGLMTFSHLAISEPIQRAIAELGFTHPSEIQRETLPILLGESTDFLGLAATGTGKTAAFGIPMLERINPRDRSVQALILCPTRELALQVSGQIMLLGKHLGIHTLAVYGGTGYMDQLHGLKRGAQIIVGTPGRVVDHINRGTLKLTGLRTLILDEADEMISMGFKEDLTTILDAAPREQSQTWLFSATMSRDVRRVADEYLRDPAQVQVNRSEMLASGVEQLYYITSEANKPEVLCKLIDAAEGFYGIIFCQTKSLVADLAEYLNERGYSVDSLHGDKDQKSRERTMQAFRDKRVTMLICTDVASRGLDVKDVTHVINYSIPKELDSYVHRIGRTARSGKTGFAMSLVSPSQRGLIARVERATKSRMQEGKIPTRKDVAVKKLQGILNQFQEVATHGRVLELLTPEWKAALGAMPSEEIAARMIAMLEKEFFAEREAGAEKPAASMPGDRRSESRGRDRDFSSRRDDRGSRGGERFDRYSGRREHREERYQSDRGAGDDFYPKPERGVSRWSKTRASAPMQQEGAPRFGVLKPTQALFVKPKAQASFSSESARVIPAFAPAAKQTAAKKEEYQPMNIKTFEKNETRWPESRKKKKKKSNAATSIQN
jgi:ATP-dependent RNA helicase DeaD